MNHTFALPDLGEGLTEAEVVTWLVAEGEQVAVDQAVVEVETAKSVVEVPTPHAGVVARLCAEPGQVVRVGLPLIEVAEQAESVDGSGHVLVGYGTRGTDGESGPRRRRRPRTGAELAAAPSERTAHQARPHPVSDDGETRVAMSPLRKSAAAAMARSRAEIPEATIWTDVDFTRLCELRESRPDGPGLLAYLARFVTAALAEHPAFNARVDAERDEFVFRDHVHLSLAVQGERGLIAPAVLDADRMTTAHLDAALRDLVARARDGSTTTRELTAGTFTLNNYGGLGVDGSAPIITHPQVAMLGIGRIIERPWVVDHQVVARRIAQVGFVFDHRVCDGVDAAAFLRAVTGAIEDPASAIERL